MAYMYKAKTLSLCTLILTFTYLISYSECYADISCQPLNESAYICTSSNFLGAGSIFDLKQNIEVDYYPKSENQTNAIQVSSCEKIMASVNAACIEKKKKEMGYRVIGIGEQVSDEEFNRLLQIPDLARKRCFNEGDLTIYCEKPIIRQMLLCFGNQYNRLINYDKFGVEEKITHKHNADNNECRDKFNQFKKQ